MPKIFWAPGATPPLPYPNASFPASDGHGERGDIYIRTTTGAQFRWNGTSWEALEPNQTRGDVARMGGALNDRLSQLTTRPFDVGWRNASDGVVFTFNQATPQQEWQVNHQLSAIFVDVTVISPGLTASDPSAVEQTIIVPEVDYRNNAVCRLIFAEPVAGTALVRR